VREVVVASIPHAHRRSRFRPVRDGLAIGLYLAGQVLSQWARVAARGHQPGDPRPWSARSGMQWRSDPGAARRLRAAALGCVAAPFMLLASGLQLAVGRLGIDLITPLVRRLYAPERLTGSPRAAPPPGGLAGLDPPLPTWPGTGS
jgi:hypothetical protein